MGIDEESRNFNDLAEQAVDEVGAVLARTKAEAVDSMCAEILRVHRIACYGVGREGLMMKALAMRLMHLGLDAHVVGDMTTPPVAEGDLLIASAGPGSCWPMNWCSTALRVRSHTAVANTPARRFGASGWFNGMGMRGGFSGWRFAALGILCRIASTRRSRLGRPVRRRNPRGSRGNSRANKRAKYRGGIAQASENRMFFDLRDLS
jgi:hypothetical protein